jgi:hypothetical protein
MATYLSLGHLRDLQRIGREVLAERLETLAEVAESGAPLPHRHGMTRGPCRVMALSLRE